MYCEEVLYKWNRPPSEKWRRLGNIRLSHTERFVCYALTIRYIIYSTVGRSIASISNLSTYGAAVVYSGYGPPYLTIYYTYIAGNKDQSIHAINLTIFFAAVFTGDTETISYLNHFAKHYTH